MALVKCGTYDLETRMPELHDTCPEENSLGCAR